MREHVETWGPATVANWGPGYDLMGAAVRGMGDRVTARWEPNGTGLVRIESITGDNGKLPLDPVKNTAGVAAQEALNLMQVTDKDVVITLEKGLPIGSGMGSSAASAAAAAWAVHQLCESDLPRKALLPALLKAEETASGWHADNVAPCLLGGFVLIQSYEPLEVLQVPAPESFWVTLVKPNISISTRDARRVVPQQITLKQHIQNAGNLGGMLISLCRGDVARMGRAIDDRIVEPARASLIPAFDDVKAAAQDAGAYGCSISGAGPTLFAVSDEESKAQAIADAMVETFRSKANMECTQLVTVIDNEGARLLQSS